MNWERSDLYEEWDGCRWCFHWRVGKCAAYPERIPLAILSGEIDHMVKRPDQVGDTLYEPIDVEHWQRTGERVPAASSASPRSTKARSPSR